jgi:hypothetical protein
MRAWVCTITFHAHFCIIVDVRLLSMLYAQRLIVCVIMLMESSLQLIKNLSSHKYKMFPLFSLASLIHTFDHFPSHNCNIAECVGSSETPRSAIAQELPGISSALIFS